MSLQEAKARIQEARGNKFTNLNLVGLNLKSIPAEIWQLSQLRELDLRNNQLSSLPPEIGQLSRLHKLDLRHNQLSSLPIEFWQLSQLQALNLGGNQLSSLPAEIGQLSRLQKLYLWSNNLSSLPAEIGQLSQLQRLNLKNNQLRSLPAELWELSQLQMLDLSRNKLKSLSAEINQLDQLRVLNLQSNQISDINLLIPFIEKGTPIVPYDMRKRLGVYLYKNPITTPPLEIVKQGNEAIRSYFESLKGKQKTLNEAKIILVGDGGAGKTSLVKRILGERFSKYESQTHGININEWEVKDGRESIKVRIWDFGGQEIMHATHQFFLSKRSLYILVLDAREEKKRSTG